MRTSVYSRCRRLWLVLGMMLLFAAKSTSLQILVVSEGPGEKSPVDLDATAKALRGLSNHASVATFTLLRIQVLWLFRILLSLTSTGFTAYCAGLQQKGSKNRCQENTLLVQVLGICRIRSQDQFQLSWSLAAMFPSSAVSSF